MELEGKCAIVTGGASGIGRATVEQFVKEGAQVVIADIADDAGEELVRQCGPTVRYKHTDVSKAEQVEGAIDFALKTLGGLDILFNNAGVSERAGKLALIDDDFSGFDRVLAVDLLGPMLGIKFAARAMRRQGSGVIINTASIGGFYAGFGKPVYRAAKAGVIALTQMAAVELGQYGIRVNCISPGPTETPMAGSGYPPSVTKQMMEVTFKVLGEMQILKRAGKPLDIAHAAVFLASDKAAQITGQNLVVDGGATVGDKVDRVGSMQEQFSRILNETGIA